jgi:hypothetical protein
MIRTSQKSSVWRATAGQLFIEGAVPRHGCRGSAQRRHLTVRQAGEIARRAHVVRVVLHFSARYRDRDDDLRREVEAAFENFRCIRPGAHPMTATRDNLQSMLAFWPVDLPFYSTRIGDPRPRTDAAKMR